MCSVQEYTEHCVQECTVHSVQECTTRSDAGVSHCVKTPKMVPGSGYCAVHNVHPHHEMYMMYKMVPCNAQGCNDYVRTLARIVIKEDKRVPCSGCPNKFDKLGCIQDSSL